MPMSAYMRELRSVRGSALILIPGVAAVVRDERRRVLLQRRADSGRWGLPAGAIDPGEAPARAIVREVREETGLVVRPDTIAGVFGGADGFRFTYANGDVVEITVTVFACTIVGGRLAIGDDESLELRFFEPASRPPLGVPYPDEIFEAPRATALFQWSDAWLEPDRGRSAGSTPP